MMSRLQIAAASVALGLGTFAAAAALAQTTDANAVAKTGVLVAGDAPTDLGPRVPQPPGNPKTFPRLEGGKPDFTGIWYAGTKDLVGLGDGHMAMPLTADYQAVRVKRVAAAEAGTPYPDYVSTCQAFGMPRIMSYGNLEFVSKPKEVWVITEVMHEVRRIFLDGQPHGHFQEPSFDGVSVGHWDGDTLVVSTTNLRAAYLNMAGAPHSDKMSIVERISYVNKNQLKDVMTITDPVALTKPFVVTELFDRRPADYEIDEYICTENYRSGGGLNLTGTAADPAAMLPPSANSDN